MNPQVEARRWEIYAFAVEGLPVKEIVRRLNTATDENLTYAAVYSGMRKMGIPRKGQMFSANDRRLIPCAAYGQMAEMYRSGLTLKQIGEQFGVTRERVRQLLAKNYGMAAHAGGATKMAEVREAQRTAARNAECLIAYGCTWLQYQQLRQIGQDMQAAGRGRGQTPIGAFKHQKNNAARRGIGWHLTLWEWWSIWQESGKWEQRGRGQGYVMARHRDQGAYERGNVYITTAVNNIVMAVRKKTSGLPVGVQEERGRYTASRNINGKTYCVRGYETAAEAAAAYRRFPEITLPACAHCGSKEQHDRLACYRASGRVGRAA